MEFVRTYSPLLPAFLIFALFAGDGLFSGLFPDEMMNLHGYWTKSWSTLIRGIFAVWEAQYRPAGALFYRPLFDAVGLEPLPYRAVCMGLLAVNLAIAARFVYALSQSIPIMAVTTVIFAYHAYLSDLYYSSGAIYDLLCFLFLYAALWSYSAWRGAGNLGPFQLTWIGLLYWMALASKEIALGLPLIVLAYEFAVFARGRRDFRTFTLTAFLASLFLLFRIWGPHALASESGYRPSWLLLLQNLEHYFGMMFYAQAKLALWLCLPILAAIAAVAYFLKQPAIRVGAAIFFVLPIPVLLIPPRSFYALYLPYLGVAIVAACLIDLLGRRFLQHPLRRAWVLVLLCTFVLVPLHSFRKPYGNAWVAAEQSKVRLIVTQLQRQLPSLPPGVHLLVVDDPFDPDDWILTFLFRLHYRDQTLQLARTKSPAQPDLKSLEPFGCTVSLTDFRLQVLRGCRP